MASARIRRPLFDSRFVVCRKLPATRSRAFERRPFPSFGSKTYAPAAPAPADVSAINAAERRSMVDFFFFLPNMALA
jgi:hypothetical protein